MNDYKERKQRRIEVNKKAREHKNMKITDCCASCYWFVNIEEDQVTDRCGDTIEYIDKETSCGHISGKIKNSKGDLINLPVKPFEICSYFIPKWMGSEIKDDYQDYNWMTPDHFYADRENILEKYEWLKEDYEWFDEDPNIWY